jgi:hypothetical protein
MFSRVTQLELDTVRIRTEDAAAIFGNEVLPRLREQPGYEGALALITSEGKGMILTFWETEDGARDATGVASEELERHMMIFRAPPGREVYEVAVSDLPDRVVV